MTILLRDVEPNNDIEAERAVIGCVLVSPEKLRAIDDLTADDFHDEHCRAAWRAIAELEADGLSFDPRTVACRLSQLIHSFSEPEAVRWLTTLMDETPHTERLASYVRRVRDAGTRRRTAVRLNDVCRVITDPTRPIDEAGSMLAAVIKDLQPDVVEANPYRPFPVHLLPGVFAEMVSAGAKAIDCDPAFLAVPLLSAMSAAIGNTYWVKTKNVFTQPLPVWTAIVAPPSTAKTPALDEITRPIREQERRNRLAYQQSMQNYDELDAKKQKEIDPPTPQRHMAADATIEALAVLLRDNPRGLLMALDELATLFGGFNQYRNGRGTDQSKWLSIWSGKPITIDRKNPECRHVYVPRPSVSITGGIQPGVLRRLLGAAEHESGLASRFFFVMPPIRPQVLTDNDVSHELAERYAAAVDRLLALTPKDADWKPHILTPTRAARDVFKEAFQRNESRKDGATDRNRAIFGKAPEYTARLAGVLTLMAWAVDSDAGNPPEEITGATMAQAVELAEWLVRETLRVHDALSGAKGDTQTEKLVDWIASRDGGRCTAVQLAQSGPRGLRVRQSTPAARTLLSRLERQRLGHWEGDTFVLDPRIAGNAGETDPTTAA